MRPSFLKRQFLIYPAVQKKVIAIFVFAGGVGFIGLVCGAILFGQKIFRLIDSVDAAASAENQVLISQIWFDFTFFLIVFGVFYVVMLFCLGLLFSHRLVGPLMRISGDISQMIETDQFKALKIRDSDFLADIVVSLNHSIEIRNQASNENKKI